MSALSAPFIADLAARLLQRVKRLEPAHALRFDDLTAATTQLAIPTRHGDVRATVYHPPRSAPARGIYVNFHGGGFVLGDYEQDDPWCRYLAVHAEIAVLNVDYALAPAHRFPVPVEQAYDVLSWAAATGRDWDGTRLCVGGQSAGGAIAAGAARLVRDLGTPPLRLQVVHYAPLDLVTPGKDKNAQAPRAMITPWLCEIFNAAYIPHPPTRRDALASPAWGENSRDIAGIAPAVVITCALDRLRDEGVRFAHALRQAGALALHYDVPDVDHAYNLYDPSSRTTTENVYRLLVEQVRRALADTAQRP
ncbi:alpha/beta hydrolase fold domain-containing protein [Nocardia sp. NPDC050713]|uniref:alpha/beta hydrolase fold domain-containing protein n=1 Tax=Nocardia sp. NPDC050713 TaxID=3154511 RepID=UPI0033FD0624